MMTMALHTTIENCTGEPIEVKVGNANLFHNTTTLNAGESHKLKVHGDLTYREYRIFCMGSSVEKNHYLDFDSDVLVENKILFVRVDGDSKCFFDALPRTAKLVERKITNKTGNARIRLIEKVDAKAGEHGGGLTIKAVLESNEIYLWKNIQIVACRQYLIEKMEPHGNKAVAEATIELRSFIDKNKKLNLFVSMGPDKLKLGVVDPHVAEPKPRSCATAEVPATPTPVTTKARLNVSQDPPSQEFVGPHTHDKGKAPNFVVHFVVWLKALVLPRH